MSDVKSYRTLLRGAAVAGAVALLSAATARPALAQGGGGGGSPWELIIIPILIHTGQSVSNQQQRKATKNQWLTVAAQRLEDIMRSELFREILGAVKEHRDLFEDHYAKMRDGSGGLISLGRARGTLKAQLEFYTMTLETAQLIASAEGLSEAEVAAVEAVVASIIEEAAGDADVLDAILGGGADAHVTDNGRLEVLDGIAGRIERHRGALAQLNRYLRYIGIQRAPAHGAVTELYD